MGLLSIISMLMLLIFGKPNDVFLSFSNQDTGKTFSDHLYKALTKSGIRTFRDQDGIYGGGKSGIEIKKAIEESRISVVVFSKDYASSTRCLDQLVLIMNARRTTGLVMFPVFYNVDPSEEMYSEAFAKHEMNFQNEMGRVQSWRAALNEAVDLAGMVLEDSFRGKDTRKNFTDHLYTALTGAGIHTFRDDDGIRRGENIELEIKKAIQEAKLSIIVFSKDYASSRWCLDELVMIMERKRTAGHIVFPVFYDVDRFEVGRQTGGYGEAFAEHEIRLKDEMQRVEGWRQALREVAYMEGMANRGIRDEIRKLKDHVDRVCAPFLDYYWQFYDSLLKLHFKFDDLDSATELVLDMHKFQESVPGKKSRMDQEKPLIFPIGSNNLKTGLKIQVMPELLQKDSILRVKRKQAGFAMKLSDEMVATACLSEAVNDASSLYAHRDQVKVRITLPIFFESNHIKTKKIQSLKPN
ncbi:unnamed protein product [Dovyalis caffra]|uniref:TIR domain-containing protein n=1 Tax=Dovyalis caffra TaxID=77055 RepID=A0AAV1RUS6_9ROSI|nr:unnamed protein product [Dovyalis caffra]